MNRLTHSEERLRLIIESAPYAMIIVDQTGKITFVNSQTEKTFGYERDELLGQSIENLIPQRYRERHAQDRGGFVSHPTTRSMGAGRDLFGLRKDGSQVPVEIGLTPMKSAEGIQVLASIVDITIRKRMEAEQQRLEREVLEAAELERKRIGQELHDSLGQQLLGIAFLSDALKEKLQRKSTEDAADAEHIANLIENVMKQARQLSRELYAAELDAHGLYEALKQLVANVNATTNIHCQFVSDGPFNLGNRKAAGHLYRIAQEALHNARRHSLATDIVVEAKWDGQVFRLVVKDNGVGLSDTLSSTGMGLKAMRYRAEGLGGAFDARNDKGGGTVISCVVPVQKDPAATDAPSAHD